RTRGRPADRHDVGTQRPGGRRVGDERRLRLAPALRRARPLHGDGHLHGHRAMTRAVVAFVLALVPASVGTSATAPPRPLALTAAPARVLLDGSRKATVRIRNPGVKRIAVDVTSAGFALDLRGRPRIVRPGAARSAARWLTLRPAHLTLSPHATAHL